MSQIMMEWPAANPLLSASERQHLLQLCRRWTGDADVAEDLVQETLLIGWQQMETLRDPGRRAQWLTGIAHNRCRQWLRSQRRQRQHLLEPSFSDESLLDGEETRHTASRLETMDVEIELDRNELATLLDRAMAQLPPLTRTVLIERFVHESPQAEVAQQLKLSEGAVEQRIQRGKLALRRILSSDLSEEAALFGLSTRTEVWQKSRLWCPCCGLEKLSSLLTSGGNRLFLLRCRACGANFALDAPGRRPESGGHRTALAHFATWYFGYFQQGLASGNIVCKQCSRSIPLHRSATPEIPAIFADMPPATPGSHGFWSHCPHCANEAHQSDLPAFALFVPAAQQFWRQQGRIKMLPERPVEWEGRSALLIRIQALGMHAQLDLLFDRTSLIFLAAQNA